MTEDRLEAEASLKTISDRTSDWIYHILQNRKLHSFK